MATSKMTLMAKVDPDSERAMKLKSDWNNYVDWLEKKKVKGTMMLDAGTGEDNLGIKYVRMYQKENPNTLISPETIKEVQSHFKNYRDFAINEIKNKRASYSGDVSKIDTPDSDFMKDLSVIDGIPGHRTTNWKFPNQFLTTIYKSPTGAVDSTVKTSQGLAPLPK